MSKEKNKGIWILVLVVVTVAAIALAVILKNWLSKSDGTALSVTGYEERGITKAFDQTGEDAGGYEVHVTTKGYNGEIQMIVRTDAALKKLTEVRIVSHQETENLGAKIADSAFLSQFAGMELPVYLDSAEGSTLDSSHAGVNDDANGTEDEVADNLGGIVTLTDGDYFVKSENKNGDYYSQVTMRVAGGRITEVIWDCVDDAGNGKRMLSQNGSYTMTEDGPVWAEQADSLAAYVIENQGVNGLAMNEDGKTDTVAGVSISIDEFVGQVAECMALAAGQGGGDSAGEIGRAHV